jgi:hypothetical protein
MEGTKESPKAGGRKASPPGIVIRDVFEPPPRPRITAFIWGGKVRPVPALPYGRRTT